MTASTDHRRPSWHATWMDVARVVANRSTCPRLAVGAVVVDSENVIVSTGYNGAPSHAPHCTEVGCEIDATGSCRRTVHAELNALLRAGPRARGGTLYTTVEPCPTCAAAIVNAGIRTVVYSLPYRQIGGVRSGHDVLSSAGVVVIHAKEDQS